MIDPRLWKHLRAKTVTLRSVLGDPVYILDGENGKKFINARTGQVWNALDKSTIKKAAIHYYMGSARPALKTRRRHVYISTRIRQS